MTEERPNRVLVVVAHPDDVDFGAAGTMARWSSQGSEIAYLIVTDGDQGGFDREIDRSEIAPMRRAEQIAAAKVVGVSDVSFLGRPDGRVVADQSLRADISAHIRRFRPTRVLAPSPERDFTRLPASHPDHLAVGEAAMCAVYPDARNPFAHPELLASGLEPHTVHELWLMGHPTQNVFVDITEYFQAKIDALHSHISQLADPKAMEGFVAQMTSATASRGGLGEETKAEAFFTIAIG